MNRAPQPYYCRSVEARDCWSDAHRIELVDIANTDVTMTYLLQYTAFW